VFVYRGQVVPVIDLHRLVGGSECPSHLISWINLVPHDGPGRGRLLGLLATQVADIREVHPDGALSSPAGGRVDLGPVVVDGSGVLRLLDPDRLLPGAAARQLLALPAEGGGANGPPPSSCATAASSCGRATSSGRRKCPPPCS
jgi:chemotaxis-related protein WspB